MIHSESTDEELFHGLWVREQYARVLLFNIVAVSIESLLVTMFILWLGNFYWGNWFDGFVLIMLPFFSYGAVLTPILAAWLWICLKRIKTVPALFCGNGEPDRD